MKLNGALTWGLVLLTLGIGATLLSGGQTVWYGAVIVGILNIGRGLAAAGSYIPARRFLTAVGGSGRTRS